MPIGQYKLLQGCKVMRWYEWVILVLCVVVPFAGGFVGARLFNDGHYKSNLFAKPDWAPPTILFSVMWSLMFVFMGIASFLLYKCGEGFNQVTIPPMILYALQLISSWTWTPLLFGFSHFGPAHSVVCALWGLAFACCITFMPITKVGGSLMVLFFIWVSFLVVLNYNILCLNECTLHVVNSTSVNN